MAAEIRIPQLGESVTEATLVRWLKQDGDVVRTDEPLLELETEKAAMDVVAESPGRLRIAVPAGARVEAGAVVGRIEEATPEAVVPPTAPPAAPPSASPGEERPALAEERAGRPPARPEPAARETPLPVGTAARRGAPAERAAASRPEPVHARTGAPSRADGRGDGTPGAPVPARQAAGRPVPEGMRTGRHEPGEERADAAPAPRARPDGAGPEDGDVERAPMSELRRTIATRLVEAQRTAAILTTINEIDLGEVVALRARHRERFKAKHGADLGLVSLFARAAIQALRDVPVVNAEIDGGDVVYHRRVHLGIAVATPRGLVVPVIRGADALSLAQLEQAIADLAARARDGTLGPRDLAGGTFTITNGGVFGSLLSTPILNPPQSGILGMHKIQDRPVARDGAVVIRPMMYVALSYDHRLVDGQQAVTFLVRVKEQLEDPARMILEV